MKRTVLLLSVCLASACLSAQTNKAGKVPPPPPPPPTVVAETPPPPPPPPPPPTVVEVSIPPTPPVVANEKGYALTVHNNNGNTMIYARKEGVTEKISLAKWNANKAYYEKKYGELPPPPPPPKAPVVEN